MKTLVLFTWFIILPLGIGAESILDEDANRDQELMQLLIQEETVLKKRLLHKHGPQWRWRYMKLLMEKYKMVHKEENQKFLQGPMELRMKHKKKWFFSKSHNLYEKIRKEGLMIVKKWPRYSSNAKIYYALASNTINHNDHLRVQRELPKYLMMVLKKTKKGSSLAKKAVASLAEHYYNQKKYGKAINYYNQLLKKKKDQWLTKHLFNLSWCHLQINQASKGLRWIKRTLFLSRRKPQKGARRYIDYSDQVIRDLPLFFSRANKVKEGVRFFIKEEENPRESLLKMANYSKEVGYYKPALHIYNHLLKKAQEDGERKDVLIIMISKLELFMEFKKPLQVSRILKVLVKEHREGPLSDSELANIIKKVKQYIGLRQEVLAKSNKKNEKLLKSVLISFWHLIQLDPAGTAHYRFYQGETLFAEKSYSRAFKFYLRAIKALKKKQKRNEEDKNIAKKSFDAMFVSLERANFSKKEVSRWRVLAYSHYLSLYPVDKHSPSIYQRLFNIHYQNKKIKECEEVLVGYVQHYPRRNDKKTIINNEHHEKQQFILTKLLNYKIAQKDGASIDYWLKKLEGGYLEFDVSYLDKISRIRSDIIFENISKQENRKQRIAKLEEVYENESYTHLVRAKAAYYIGENLIAELKTKSSLLWFERTLTLMTPRERSGFQEGILEHIHEMVYLQDFDNAYQLANTVLKEACEEKTKKSTAKKFRLKNDFFNANILYAMVAQNYEDAYKGLEYGRKCAVSDKLRRQNLEYMAQFHLIHRNYKHFDRLLAKHNEDKKLRNFFAQALLEVYWGAIISESIEQEKYILGHLSGGFGKSFMAKGRKSIGREIQAVLKFYKLREELGKDNLYHFSFGDSSQKFNEEKFNKTLEAYLAELGEFTSQITGHLNSGYPQIVSYGYLILSRRYRAFGESLLAFRPQGVDKNYQESFLQTMKELAKQFLGESKKQQQLGVNLLNKQQVLLYNGSGLVLGENHVINAVRHRHPASLYTLTVDRGSQVKKKGRRK